MLHIFDRILDRCDDFTPHSTDYKQLLSLIVFMYSRRSSGRKNNVAYCSQNTYNTIHFIFINLSWTLYIPFYPNGPDNLLSTPSLSSNISADSDFCRKARFSWEKSSFVLIFHITSKIFYIALCLSFILDFTTKRRRSPQIVSFPHPNVSHSVILYVLYAETWNFITNHFFVNFKQNLMR